MISQRLKHSLVLGTLLLLPFWLNAQELSIIQLEVINEPEMDYETGRLKPTNESPLYVAQLLMEVEGDLSQLANVEVKLNKFSKDLKSDALVFDRKISYSIKEDAERGSRIIQKGSMILVELGTFSEPAHFKAKVVLEDKSGKKTKPFFYSRIKE